LPAKLPVNSVKVRRMIMGFDPKKLPPTVESAFRQGPLAWALVVERAIGVRIYDLNKLTDIVFYLHYPERIGNPLKTNETALINKWKAFRVLIKPRLNTELSEVEKLRAENLSTPTYGGGYGNSSFLKMEFDWIVPE